jgi:hypothetical protein
MVNSGVSTISGNAAVSVPIPSSKVLEFISFTSQTPAEIYCLLVGHFSAALLIHMGADSTMRAQFSTSPNGSPYPGPLLAVNGDADHFHICPGGQGARQEVVVYNSTTTSQCAPAHIVIQEQ